MTSRAVGFSAARGRAQLGVFVGGAELSFETFEDLADFVRRIYVGSGSGDGGGGAGPPPAPVEPRPGVPPGGRGIDEKRVSEHPVVMAARTAASDVARLAFEAGWPVKTQPLDIDGNAAEVVATTTSPLVDGATEVLLEFLRRFPTQIDGDALETWSRGAQSLGTAISRLHLWADIVAWATVPRYCRNNLPTWLMRANMTEELADVMLDPAWVRQREGERGRAQDTTFDIEAAASHFLASARTLHLAPFCHQYSRSTGETLPTLIEVLALSGQQRRALALADNVTDVADRMLAFRGLAQIYAADGELKSAGQCAREVERTLPAMHADHHPMAWCWAAQGHIAAKDKLRAGLCAWKAADSVSKSDKWDRINGFFWAAMAARSVADDDLRLDIVRQIEASGKPFRNQHLQAASVAGCHDLLRRSLADRLAWPADSLEPIRHGNLALALIDAGLGDEMDLLVGHVGALRPPGESDSLKRWVWALARSGRFAQLIEAIAWIDEPVEYSKAIARIAPILVDHGDAKLLSCLRALLLEAMPSEDPDTQARLIRALWVVGDQELALAAAEKAIASGASD